MTRSVNNAERIELVSADMAAWISGPITERVPDAHGCVDPFHVVMLAPGARRRSSRGLERGAPPGRHRARPRARRRPVRGVEDPENLTDRQAVERGDPHPTPPVPRVPAQGATAPDLPAPGRRGESPARRLAEVGASITFYRRFVKLARTITEQRDGILAAIQHGLSNAASNNRRPDPTHRTTRVRVPPPPGADRARAMRRTRRPLPAHYPGDTTHGNVGDSEIGNVHRRGTGASGCRSWTCRPVWPGRRCGTEVRRFRVGVRGRDYASSVSARRRVTGTSGCSRFLLSRTSSVARAGSTSRSRRLSASEMRSPVA